MSVEANEYGLNRHTKLMKKIEAEVATTEKDFFVGVLYFGWPNQPSSGTMRILHWYVILMLHIL